MKRHPLDLLSLVLGLLVVAVAVAALAGGLTLDLLTTDWVWPALLVGLGVLVLASAGLGRRQPDDRAPTDAPAPGDEAEDTVEREWPAG